MRRIDLRRYQQMDVKRGGDMKRLLHTGEPGTGKTVIGTRIVEEAEAFPCLVTAPGYLVDQWNEHLIDEGHGGDILVAATVQSIGGRVQTLSPQQKRELLERARDEKVHWVIVNHEMLRTPPRQHEKSVREIWKETAREKGWVWGEEEFRAQRPKRPINRYDVHKGRFASLIVDESHRLRGHKSQQFRGAYAVANRDRCQRVIELTATPIYRDVGDLYAQLRLLDGKRFTSYWGFARAHALIDEDEWGDRIVGALPTAATTLARYAIHRGYTDPDVLLDIPPLIPRTIRCNLSPKGMQEYKRKKKDFVGTGQYLPTLRRLTGADAAKLHVLDELVADVEHQGYIVFTYYRETAKLLGKRLGVPVALGGQKGNVALAKSVGPRRALSTDPPTAPGLVATIDCLEAGVDLSHLRAVIFYEEDYLPGKRKQAAMRVQRFRPDGSADPVLMYWIITRNTIDERVHTVAEARGATMEEIVNMEQAA